MITFLDAPLCEQCGFHMKPHPVDITGFNERPQYVVTWSCPLDKCPSNQTEEP